MTSSTKPSLAELTSLYSKFFDAFRQAQGIPDSTQFDKTPERVVKAMLELTEGYHQSPEEILSKSFDDPLDEEAVPSYSLTDGLLMVWGNIPIISNCAHHLLPMIGYAHIGMVVDKSIIGLSKVPRVVQALAKRLQVQEELGLMISKVLTDIIPKQTNCKVLGTAVLLDLAHFCMRIRGVKMANSAVTTSHLTGIFLKDDKNVKAEFLQLVAPYRQSSITNLISV
jgi:GTP cyclohydrolase I